MGVGLSDELSWEIDLFKIYESSKERQIDQSVDTFSRVEDHLENDVKDEGNVTVHIWLSMQFLHETRPPHSVILENNFVQRFVKAVTDLDAKTSRPILVSLNGDSMFNCMDSMRSRVARELAESMRAKGILVASDQRLYTWRSMYANFGRQFPILQTQRKGTLGKTSIWAVIVFLEKAVAQKDYTRCYREHVSTLNERAYKPDQSGIDPELLKSATGSTKTFAIAGGEMQEEDYVQMDATVFQKKDPTTTTRFTKDKRFKVHWVESTLPMHELEPCPQPGSWFPVTSDDKDFLCIMCRGAKSMDEMELNQYNPTFCINCSANCQDHYKKSAPTLGARKAVLMMAARLRIAFEKCGLNYVNISIDFQKWLAFAASSVIANLYLPYGEELMKSLSHMGGVRIPAHQAKEIFKNVRGKQFSVYRECLYDDKAKRKVLAYRLMRDCGNVAYKDFLEQVAVPDVNERNEIFAHTRMSAEKAGDVIEFWLGVFDVANMSKDAVDVFPSSVDPADFLNGLERALRGFGRVSRTTTTINDKRRGSFDCTLQPGEAKDVLDLLSEIPDYHSLPNFTCLNAYETAHVIEVFRKKIGFIVDDANMGEAEAEPGFGSTTHPGEAEADPNQDDDASQAAEESARTARQKLMDALGALYDVSEKSTVCPYCGSTEHDHICCEHPNKANVSKVLKGIRKVLEEGRSPSDDVEMDQEGEKTEQPEGATTKDEPMGSPMEEEPEPAKARTGEYFWYNSVMEMTEGQTTNEQVLAFGICPDVDRNGETFRSSGLDPNVVIPEEGLLLYPLAIRAPSGHKESKDNDVFLKPSVLSHPLTPTTAMMLPTCFHVTHKDNLRDIWKEGLIPGGMNNSRIFTFFNPYAPWDSRAWRITKSVDTRIGVFATRYIPTETLMNEFGGLLTDSCQVVTNKVVPFPKLRGGWVQDYQQRWIRLIVPSGEEQVVRSGYRLATQCANSAEQPYGEDTMDVFTILSRFENYQIPEGGKEQYEARQKLLDYILERKPVSASGCRLCPLCICETPVMLSICFNCWGMLESHGIRPFHMNHPDDDEDATLTKELDEQIRKAKEEVFKATELDEQIRKAKEEVFKATVDEAQDQQALASETQSQFDFNPDEVDYTGDDEDMEEEEDIEVEEEREEEVDAEQEQADEEARQESEKCLRGLAISTHRSSRCQQRVSSTLTCQKGPPRSLTTQ
eukprot:s3204_g11.t1